MTDPAEIHDPGVLRTILRGLALLEQVIIADGEARAKSLADKVGLNKSSCYQMLKTLELAGYVVHTPAGTYAVGPSVPAMFSHLRAVLVPEPRVAQALHALRDETGDTSYACALRGHTILLQAVAEGRRALVVRMLRPGMRDNIHARASCRAILSQLGETEQNRILPARSLPSITKYTATKRRDLRVLLREARDKGYAVERQEFEEGVACLAAPYLDADGAVAGSLTVAMPVGRMDTDEAAIAKTVRHYAAQASHPAVRP